MAYFLKAKSKGNPKIDNDKVFKVLNKNDKHFINPWNNDVCRVPSRHLVVGASETGKSFAICQFLVSESNPYTFPYGKTFYMIHPTSKGQVKLENTKDYLDDISKEHDEDYKSFSIIVSKDIDSSIGEIMGGVKDCEEKNLNFLLIVDDAYGTDTMRSNFLLELYVKGRHKNISVMLLTQVALSSKVMKDIRRNINYLWLFQSYQEDTDTLMGQIISRRFPERREEFYKNYVEGTTTADYGYIVYSPFITANKYRINCFFPEGATPKSQDEMRKEIADAEKEKSDNPLPDDAEEMQDSLHFIKPASDDTVYSPSVVPIDVAEDVDEIKQIKRDNTHQYQELIKRYIELKKRELRDQRRK